MRQNMKWVGIITSVVAVLLFTVSAGATVPFADDLPGTRILIQGSTGSPTTLEPAFDLDEYVIDNNNTDGDLSWGVSVEAGGPVVNIDSALHDADVLAVATAGVYGATYTVTDPDTESDDTVSEHKYSSFWLTEPKFTSDGRLSVKPVQPFTIVKLFDGSGAAEQTADLSAYVTESASVDFGPLKVYDLASGAPVKVAEGNSVNLGGLQASVNTASGVVTLTPVSALTNACALLISIPAVLQGSSLADDGDWDGKTIMVAPAKDMDSFGGWSAGGESLAMNSRFENIPVGASIQPGAAPTNALSGSTFLTAAWRANTDPTVTGDGSVAILTPAQVTAAGLDDPAKNFPGSRSGNCLALTLDSDEGVSLESFNITPVQPGEIYGISCNIATDLAAGQNEYNEAARFKLAVNTQPDLGMVNAAALIGNSNATRKRNVLPTDKNWRQIYTEITIPALNSAVDNTLIGDTGTTNMMDKGIRLNIRAECKGTVSAPFNVYIDNVYVYCKGMSDINVFDSNGEAGGLVEKGLAAGVTAFDLYTTQVTGYNDEKIDGGFEAGTILQENNFFPDDPGLNTVALVEGTNVDYGVGTFGRLDAQSYEFQFTTAATRDADNGAGIPENHAIRINSQQIALTAIDKDSNPIAGAPLVGGEGYYGVTFWVSTESTSVVENPRVKVNLAETRPSLQQVIGGVLVGPSALPVAGQGWQQYRMVAMFPETNVGEPAAERLQLSIQPSANYSFRTANIPAFGPYNAATTKPGYEADGIVRIDDIVVHRVRDLEENYFQYSLFQ